MKNLFLIVRREYLERVNGKSFIITTLLMPLLMVGLMMAPALIMVFSGPESKQVAVLDASGVIAPALPQTDEVTFTAFPAGFSLDTLKTMDEFDAVLVIGQNVVKFPQSVQLYTHSAPSIQTEGYLSGVIAEAITRERAKAYDIPNIREIVDDLQPEVTITTTRLDKDTEQEASPMASYFVGMMCAMILYFFIMIYGNMVMTSIIEEKNNRVLEIIVSSVKPNVLMMGKILGIGAVALTQILIWAVLVGSFSKWVMPLVINSVGTGDMELATALGQLSQTGYIMMLFVWIVLFLALGFVFYSTIYAAIGSAVDNIQDASQLASIAVVPIILGFVFTMSAISDPNSSLSVWMSMIPFTSPMVMMARIPFGIPAWQIIASLAILAVSSLLMVWLCAKIYRVGIFMYGKKPTVRDLIRWARYK